MDTDRHSLPAVMQPQSKGDNSPPSVTPICLHGVVLSHKTNYTTTIYPWYRFLLQQVQHYMALQNMQSSLNANIDTSKEQAVFCKFMLMADFYTFMNQNTLYVRSEFLIVVVMQSTIFWVVMPCSSLKGHTLWKNMLLHLLG